MKCPNCSEQIEESDLVGNKFGVTHCGCFYESDPDKVRWHFMKEIETEDYIIDEFKKEIFKLFNSRDDYQLNERAKMLEEDLNCKIGTFENLRTGIKKLTMEFEYYDLDKNKHASNFCKIIHKLVLQKDDSILMEMIHDISEMLSCTNLEIEGKEVPSENDVITMTIEWRDIYALVTTP